MEILNKYVTTTLIVKNSKFIAEVFPCKKETDARSLLKSQKEKYQDASHVVHCFVLGSAQEILGMSDAGEPSGTAGRPMLDVVKGSGITNILLTTTRYFGGTLLGTGGLVKAYSDSAKSVLEKSRMENALEYLVAKKDFSFSITYSLYDVIKYNFSLFSITDLKESFEENINITGKILESEYNEFASKIKNISLGKINL